MRSEGLLYQNGDWGIYTGASVGLEQYYSDVVHECYHKKGYDTLAAISYQIMGMTICPGCGETQPDDIQTLWQLHNMDKPTPTKIWGKGPLAWTSTSQTILNRITKETIKKK